MKQNRDEYEKGARQTPRRIPAKGPRGNRIETGAEPGAETYIKQGVT